MTPQTEETPLPSGFGMRPRADGLGVTFPKMLLDRFKGAFRTRKWDPTPREWVIPMRNRKKAEAWVKEMEPLLPAIKLEAKAADLANEASRLNLPHKTVEQIAAARSAEAIAANAEMLQVAREQRHEAERERKANEALIETTLRDLGVWQTVHDAAETMREIEPGPPRTASRGEYEYAQKQIGKAIDTLAEAGLRWQWANQLWSLNYNRCRDRDTVRSCGGRYTLRPIPAATVEGED